MLNVLGKIMRLLLGYNQKTKVIKNGCLRTKSFGILQEMDISFMETGENTGKADIAQARKALEVLKGVQIDEGILIQFITI